MDMEKGSLCKYYAAGYCHYGSKCNGSHDAQAILDYTNGWLRGEDAVGTLSAQDTRLAQPQKFKAIVILDLEGKDEIIEFPVLILACDTWTELGRWHRWCRPTGFPSVDQMQPEQANLNSDAIPFGQAVTELNEFLAGFGLVDQQGNPQLEFVCCICGNWDIGSQIPKCCGIARMQHPSYFDQWINLKDFALNFMPQHGAFAVRGMVPMMKLLKLPMVGTHHLGMDDVCNIGRVLIRLAELGAVFTETAWRDNPRRVRDISYRYPPNMRVTPETTGGRRDGRGGQRGGRDGRGGQRGGRGGRDNRGQYKRNSDVAVDMGSGAFGRGAFAYVPPNGNAMQNQHGGRDGGRRGRGGRGSRGGGWAAMAQAT
eukprot:TRINITY_DN75537_c0_g1_i1.p1 TRINITY_DN75537_c0_g1~~TRINITY_DN75537_c0_g1_i1.p1  ORF type:complete len:369 (-),score=24.56 TRINITY_DN75537_c0_g1_i1:158-1264(-)